MHLSYKIRFVSLTIGVRTVRVPMDKAPSRRTRQVCRHFFVALGCPLGPAGRDCAARVRPRRPTGLLYPSHETLCVRCLRRSGSAVCERLSELWRMWRSGLQRGFHWRQPRRGCCPTETRPKAVEGHPALPPFWVSVYDM